MNKMMNTNLEQQLAELAFGTLEITPLDEFKQMLAHSLKNNKPLRVKCGIDPTGTDVHLGHMVAFKKMRKFQDLGHTGVVIIGDYTAQIGDPTGKNESRPRLSAEQVAENSKRYMEQVYQVLDESRTEVHYQSEWFNSASLADILNWAGQTTVAKLIAHETFKNRLQSENSLGLHELFYPVLQGIDSVYIKADVELGGSDQKFNVLMGRDYQRQAKLRPQVALLLPLLMGLDGQEKMSKSLNNYIGVLDEPFDKFGKVMSIPDELMETYVLYAGSYSKAEAEAFIQELKTLHPNEAKKQLASNIVDLYHGESLGQAMRAQFEAVFAKGKVPDEVPEYSLKQPQTLLDVLVLADLVSSKGEGRRLITQKAVGFVDGAKMTDPQFILTTEHQGQVIKAGKRKFLRLIA